jgi:large subunit ribosomal protein L2
VHHKGGGNRKIYRKIDWRYHVWWINGEVEWISKDPNRTGWIATVSYQNGVVTNLLAYENAQLREKIINGPTEDIKNGIGGLLRDLKIGAKIYNVEKNELRGGKIARAAGSFVTIIRRSTHGLVLLRTKRRKNVFSNLECAGTYGVVSNDENQLENWKKAGKSRQKGIRPTVRGVAMNPVDHPHGGGEGKSKGGSYPKTPWGKLTKGKRTTSLKKKKKYKLFLKKVFQ